MAQRDDDSVTTVRAGTEGSASRVPASKPGECALTQPAQPPVTYSMSPGFAAFLGASRIGLAVSSYQSGKFYLLGQNVNGGLIVDERFFRKAMGICVADRDTILLATLLQVFRFRNVLDAGQQINNVFDACYVPREAPSSPASSTRTT
jgi:hypothetical protein